MIESIPANMGQWSVRDMLVRLLEQIDNGEIAPTSAIFIHATKIDDRYTVTSIRVAMDTMTLLGIMRMAEHRMMDEFTR